MLLQGESLEKGKGRLRRLFLLARLFCLKAYGDVLAVVACEVDGNVGGGVEGAVLTEGGGFGVGGDDVVGGAGGEALGEFAARVGGAFVFRLFGVGGAD